MRVQHIIRLFKGSCCSKTRGILREGAAQGADIRPLILELTEFLHGSSCCVLFVNNVLMKGLPCYHHSKE